MLENYETGRMHLLTGCLLQAPNGGPDPPDACVLMGNRTHDLLVFRPVLSPLSHTSQGFVHLLVWCYTNIQEESLMSLWTFIL